MLQKSCQVENLAFFLRSTFDSCKNTSPFNYTIVTMYSSVKWRVKKSENCKRTQCYFFHFHFSQSARLVFSTQIFDNQLFLQNLALGDVFQKQAKFYEVYFCLKTK